MRFALWCCLFAIWTTAAFGLTCQYGSTFPSAGAQSGVFTDEDCGVGNYVCEYRESVQESGYGSMCTTHQFCEDDATVRTYQWKNVKCCNDSNDCSTSGTSSTSGASSIKKGPILELMLFWLSAFRLGWGLNGGGNSKTRDFFFVLQFAGFAILYGF